MNRGEKLAKRERFKAFHRVIVEILGMEGIPASYIERQEDILMAKVD